MKLMFKLCNFKWNARSVLKVITWLGIACLLCIPTTLDLQRNMVSIEWWFVFDAPVISNYKWIWLFYIKVKVVQIILYFTFDNVWCYVMSYIGWNWPMFMTWKLAVDIAFREIKTNQVKSINIEKIIKSKLAMHSINASIKCTARTFVLLK